MTSKIKLVLKDEIKVLLMPATLAELQEKVKEMLKGKLPATFDLVYVNTDGTNVLLNNQTVYATLAAQKSDSLKVLIQEKVSSPEEEKGANDFELVEHSGESPVLKEKEWATQTNVVGVQEKGTDSPPAVPTKNESANTDKTSVCEIASAAAPETQEKAMQFGTSADKGDSAPVCLLCHGTKTSGGQSCAMCKGAGSLTKEILELIKRIFLTETQKPARAAPSPLPHPNVKCDSCGMTPIVGIRYNCAVCPNFDLCERCEAQGKHDHAMLKLRTPTQAAQLNPKPSPAAGKPSAPKVYKLESATAEPIKYKVKCVAEDIQDGHQVGPGERFAKMWTLQNVGETKWPADTSFGPDGGDDFQASVVKVGELTPKAQIDVRIEMVAPQQLGKAVAFFRLATSKGVMIGLRCWVDILVVDRKKSTLQPETVDISVLHVPPAKTEPKPLPRVQESTIEERKLVERVKKLSQLAIPAEFQDNMHRLFEMDDSLEPELALKLLKENKNNIAVVAEILFGQSHI